MAIMHEIELGGLPGWQRWRCAAGTCPQELLRVRRRAPAEEVWLIHERPGWVIAASQPVCPACGTTLRRET
jgi:hypothetical protein